MSRRCCGSGPFYGGGETLTSHLVLAGLRACSLNSVSGATQHISEALLETGGVFSLSPGSPGYAQNGCGHCARKPGYGRRNRPKCELLITTGVTNPLLAVG